MNFFFEVAVGGGDDSHVDVSRLVGADGADFVVLDDAQKLDLGVERHVADFVEEDGAAVCVFEKPDAFVLGAGECSAGVAEQFAFEEGFGNGTAVDGDEFVVNAGDCSCDEVFTDSGFAKDEHGPRVQNGAFYVLAQAFHRLAFADEMRHPFAENAFCIVDFLESRNLAHQVETESFYRKDGVVEFA